MPPNIIWPNPKVPGELKSAFQRGEGERPLRFTFHTQTFKDLPPPEKDALDLLGELARLPIIDVKYTDEAHSDRVVLRPVSSDFEYIQVREYGAGECKLITAISRPQSPDAWRNKASELAAREPATSKDDVSEVNSALLFAQAHYMLSRDVFVTGSDTILKNRQDDMILRANCRSPLEALKLAGLYLRSRGQYTFATIHGVPPGMNRGLYYWVLARYKLRSMWQYFSACLAASKGPNEELQPLGSSILNRSVRALQAVDAIGVQLHLPQSNDTRDEIMYHFDYLTLLLAGAFDAQSRVARLVYEVKEISESAASFRNKTFLKALKSHGASVLSEYIRVQHVSDVLSLLHQLRNTIHGGGFPTITYGDASGSQPDESYINVPNRYAAEIREVVTRRGGLEQWGMREDIFLVIEAYTFAKRLVNECLDLLDTVAAETDVTRLLSTEDERQRVSVGPPPNHPLFNEWVGYRLELLS